MNRTSIGLRTKGALASLLAALFLVVAALPAQATDAEVRTQVERWFDVWDTGTEPIDWERFRPLFMPGENAILVVDDFGGGVTTIRSYDEYVETWAPVMRDGFRSWSIRPAGEIEVRTGRDLAVANFVLEAAGTTSEGERVTPRQRGTLTFARDSEGVWRIVQEQLRTLPADAGTDRASVVRERVLAWGRAWVVGDAAETFDLAPLVAEYYAPDVLAFDTSDDAGQTVIRGADEFTRIWQPFVRGWDEWEFNVLPDSVDVRMVSPDMAWATLYIDNRGVRADGTVFDGPAQGTMVWKKRDGRWVIVHEHISLPRRDPQR